MSPVDKTAQGEATPAAPQAVTLEAAGPSLLDEILKANRIKEAEPEVRKYHSDLVGQLVEDIMKGEMKVSGETEQMLNDRIAEIDQLLSDQLNEIMHDEEFQKLEASWRGLHYLVFESETGTMMQIRVLNTSKKELLRDLERAKEFDQSALFKKIYSSEYDVFGGTPYGALIGDYEFGKHPQDMALLKRISQVAAAAHAPFIAAASPQLFGWGSFTDMPPVRDLAEIFRTREYDKWKSFRESEDSRYIGLCLPHTLMRLPYGKATVPVDGFDFEEDVDGRSHEKYLWGNAAYAMGARLTDAFARYGWCASIRGVEGGGLVEGLPTHTFQTDEGDVALKCPTEIAITDRREKELADQGLVPLVHCKGTDKAAFFSVQSANKPKLYDTDAANANARLSAQLPYIMATCRFAHYLKAMMRDRIGSFTSKEELQMFFNRWITQYVTTDDTASQATKAKYPLREA